MKRINEKKLAAFRKTHQREIFLGKQKTYDIVVALFLIEQSGQDAEVVDVEQMAIACGFDKRPFKVEDGFDFFRRPDGSTSVIELEYMQRDLDLNKPLILANNTLIDGQHRLYRAFMLGIEEMRAYMLTEDEARMC